MVKMLWGRTFLTSHGDPDEWSNSACGEMTLARCKMVMKRVTLSKGGQRRVSNPVCQSPPGNELHFEYYMYRDVIH
jgi:hypothetical protein